MVGIAANIISRGTRRRHNDHLMSASDKVYTGVNYLSDLALSRAAFSSNIEEGLLASGRIIRVVRLG